MKRYLQIFSEGIIPILGFYFWSWSWYFVLLFYVLDVLAKETLIFFQSKKILETQGGDQALKTWRKNSMVSWIINSILLLLLHLGQYILAPKTNFAAEIHHFLMHKELGIPQGFLLFPLLCMVVYMQYKKQFLAFNLHQKLTITALWNNHVRWRSFVLICVSFGLIITLLLPTKDWMWLWGSALLPLVFHKFIQKSV